MELVAEIMFERMPDLINIGFGYGSIIAIVAIMTGYVISKVQSLVNDK